MADCTTCLHGEGNKVGGEGGVPHQYPWNRVTYLAGGNACLGNLYINGARNVRLSVQCNLYIVDMLGSMKVSLKNEYGGKMQEWDQI